MALDNTDGKVELIFMVALSMEQEKVKGFGYRIYFLIILTFTKDPMKITKRMDSVCINGQMGRFMMDTLRMI